ncbi:[4Fe-4S] proteins maturation [Lobosporangium transversale]|nr:[4Fe-4S] proteins maturation [Lobosporangium transversale]
MGSCFKCLVRLSPPTSITRVARNRACAALVPTFLGSTQRAFARLSKPRLYSTITSAAHRHSSCLQSSPFVISSIPGHQTRLNSSSAAAVVTSTPTEGTSSSIKIHNPQIDESGKQLTLDITDKAVKQLKRIAIRDQNPLLALRITVDSGGCHGYQYLMDLTDTVNDDDVVFEKDGARVIVDTITLPMISGSKIDFIEELIGSAFKVLGNPHAAHSCGCDTSFEIKI